MNINVEEVEYCKIKVLFEADPKQVEEKRAEVFGHFRKAAIPGFRQGKAPDNVVLYHFNSRIEDATKQELAQAAFLATIGEKNYRPFGQPLFLSSELAGTQFSCEFFMHKLPDVELKTYKGFNLPKSPLPSSVEMAEKTLQELRVRNGEALPFEENDFLQEKDQAIINYKGFVGDSQEPSLVKEASLIVVGNSPIQGFDDNILGMKVGEIRTFELTTPDNFDPQELAGKTVRMEVELMMGSKITPAALDDALAKKLGLETVQDLINMTQGAASSRTDELDKKYLSEQISIRLLENHTLDIPDWLATYEAKVFAKQVGFEWDDISDEHKEGFLAKANKNIKLAIILDKIRENEPEAQMTDEEVIDIIYRNLPLFKKDIPNLKGKEDMEVIKNIQESGLMPALLAQVKNDFTIDFIIKNSTIIE